jgi:hypothetical protein
MLIISQTKGTSTSRTQYSFAHADAQRKKARQKIVNNLNINFKKISKVA